MCVHEWVGGAMVVHREDVPLVMESRGPEAVECQFCEAHPCPRCFDPFEPEWRCVCGQAADCGCDLLTLRDEGHQEGCALHVPRSVAPDAYTRTGVYLGEQRDV